MGSNDIFAFYITSDHRNQTQSHDQFVSMLTSQLENQLKGVYELGGRKFVVFGLGQIGCVPTARSFVGNHKCIDDLNKLVKLFNQYMKPRIQKLQSNFPGMKISYINTYDITLSMVTHPKKYSTYNKTPIFFIKLFGYKKFCHFGSIIFDINFFNIDLDE